MLVWVARSLNFKSGVFWGVFFHAVCDALGITRGAAWMWASAVGGFLGVLGRGGSGGVAAGFGEKAFGFVASGRVWVEESLATFLTWSNGEMVCTQRSTCFLLFTRLIRML